MRKTAVITGATSGIGAAYAKRLAADGYDLIITGRRKEIIEKLADDLRKRNGINVNLIIAELSNDSDVQNILNAINADDNIEMLINNAGHSGYMKPFIDIDPDHYENMIKVHQIVPLKLISAVTPKMMERKKGVIINVASIGAFLPLPTTSVYNATKSFVKLFSEALYQELKDSGIKVQALCPGFTSTDFGKAYLTEREYADYLEKTKNMTSSPEQVVDYSLKSLKKNRAICMPGMVNKVMTTLMPSLPRSLFYKFASKMVDM